MLVRVDSGEGREKGVPFVPLPPPPGTMVESPARKILGVARSSRMGVAYTMAAIAKNGTVDKDFMIEAWEMQFYWDSQENNLCTAREQHQTGDTACEPKRKI